jgi:tetratricopeptide (TPR) repeat protein
MKPILMYFCKSQNVLEFSEKTKDPEVLATVDFDKEIFARFAITELAKEFINIKVDLRKADMGFLAKTYGVRTAPVIIILDFNANVLYRLASAKLNFRQLGKCMETALKRVEGDVKKLAASKDESPIVARAKTRAAEIEMRDDFGKGMDFACDMKWDLAEKSFKKVIDRTEENKWKKSAQDGMIEVKAGKLFVEGEQAYKNKNYTKSKELLDQVIKLNESRFWKPQAIELLKKVNKKLS